MNATSFPPDVAARLKWYVYRLIDPRNGETFYVGKGKDNRVYAHAGDTLVAAEPSDKQRRIRDIHLAGFAVAHVIHRHGLDERTAFEVEAALMDAYPGLTNVAGGVGSFDFGAMHADEIVRRYRAEEARFEQPALLVRVHRSAVEAGLYDATRYAWSVDPRNAQRMEVVLAVIQGMIVGAFTAERWREATLENFPGREPMPGRYGFEGGPAPADVQALYLGKRVPPEYRRRGDASAFRYAKPIDR